MFHRATQAGLGGKEIDAWELGLADLEIFVFGNKGDFSLERDWLAIQCGFLGNFQVAERLDEGRGEFRVYIADQLAIQLYVVEMVRLDGVEVIDGR